MFTTEAVKVVQEHDVERDGPLFLHVTLVFPNCFLFHARTHKSFFINIS